MRREEKLRRSNVNNWHTRTIPYLESINTLIWQKWREIIKVISNMVRSTRIKIPLASRLDRLRFCYICLKGRVRFWIFIIPIPAIFSCMTSFWTDLASGIVIWVEWALVLWSWRPIWVLGRSWRPRWISSRSLGLLGLWRIRRPVRNRRRSTLSKASSNAFLIRRSRGVIGWGVERRRQRSWSTRSSPGIEERFVTIEKSNHVSIRSRDRCVNPDHKGIILGSQALKEVPLEIIVKDRFTDKR